MRASEEDANGRRRRSLAWRPILLGVGAVLAFLVTAIAAGFLVAPKWGTTLALRGALALSGIADVRFTVEDARWRKLVLADVALGDVASARRAAAAFGALGPFGGVRRLEGEGLRLSGTFDENGLSFGALDPILFAGGGGGAIALPSVALKDAALALSTPYATVSLRADAIDLDGAQGGSARAALAIIPRAGAPIMIAPHQGDITLSFSPSGALSAQMSLGAPAPQPPPPQSGAVTPQGPLAVLFNSATIALDRAARESGWKGHVAFDAGLDGKLGHSLFFDKGGLAFKGRFELKGGKVTVFTDNCAALRNIRVALTSFSATGASFGLCTQAPDRALLTSEDGALTVAALVPSANIALQDAQGDLVAGTLPALTIGVARKPTGWRASLKAQGGNLTAPAAALSLSALDVSGEVAGEGDALKEGALRLAHGEVADTTSAPRFAPLALQGKVDLAGRRLVFALDAAAGGAGGETQHVAHIDGAHDLDTSEGEAALALDKLTFAQGALQPDMLLPLLRGTITRASGAVGGKASFAWGAQGFRSEANLALYDLGFHAGFAELQGVNGKVALSSLFPLETAAPQEIRVRTMDVGLPLADGVLRFEFAKGIDIRVREASFPFLSGKVFLEPFELGRGAKKITLAFDQVDLKELLELVDIKGLAGTGRLTARVPVIFEGDRQIIKDGHAEAEAPGGSLTYKNPEAAANAKGGETEILFKALDDFRYSALSVDLAGPLDGTLSLKVHLKGNNPALYSGYPVELNVSTEGPFVNMLRNGLYAYRRYGGQ